ncbi:hypothetical protein DPMN_013269 [Dreissena polymorpha]|uniref:Uncharacterized protein n=1 Tax=Dreissena polymorpha TaxID=45954 RepID=A0A9D4N405_DREPO|nr:hypothetical protein DPMN_013269 [Dreissena polymorpha]
MSGRHASLRLQRRRGKTSQAKTSAMTPMPLSEKTPMQDGLWMAHRTLKQLQRPWRKQERKYL